MTVAPRVDDPEDVRPVFRRLRELRDGLGLRELSMGMTDDFEVAVEEGSTFVRVGRAIFGDRPVPRLGETGVKIGLVGCGFMGEAMLSATLDKKRRRARRCFRRRGQRRPLRRRRQPLRRPRRRPT